MKKYIAPSLQVVNVDSQNLCLGSNGEYNDGLTTTVRGYRRNNRSNKVADFDEEDEFEE